MLWTTIGILTLLLILGLGAQHQFLGQGLRVRWFLRLMAAWGINTALGALVFRMVYDGRINIESYWVWKPLLVGSSIVFMCLSAACLYVVRHVSSDTLSTFQPQNRGIIMGGVTGLALGIITNVWLWF